MTDRQFEIFVKFLDSVADDMSSMRWDGISSGSFTANSMQEFLNSLKRIATALEEEPRQIEAEKSSGNVSAQWRLLAAAFIMGGDPKKEVTAKDAVELVDAILLEIERQNIETE